MKRDRLHFSTRHQQIPAFHGEAPRDSALRAAESRRCLDRLRGTKSV
jgi:hypothetical protein